MKIIIILLISLVICFFGFVGCDEPKVKDKSDYKIEIPSDETNQDEKGSSDLEKEEQDEDEMKKADETKKEEQETAKEDKIETDIGSWSKDVQI